MTEPAEKGFFESERLAAFSRIMAFYERPRSQGERAEYKATSRGMFAASPAREVFRLFTEIELESYGSLCDLGSGDGVVAHVASLFTEAWGLEIDPSLVDAARHAGASLGLEPGARFVVGDYLEHDLSGFDALYIYPDRPVLEGLEEKLLEGFGGVLVVYGPHFRPRHLKKLWGCNLGRGAAVVYTT